MAGSNPARPAFTPSADRAEVKAAAPRPIVPPSGENGGARVSGAGVPRPILGIVVFALLVVAGKGILPDSVLLIVGGAIALWAFASDPRLA